MKHRVFNAGDSDYEIMVEPGRSIVATTGTLLCSVLGTKVGQHINTSGECGNQKCKYLSREAWQWWTAP